MDPVHSFRCVCSWLGKRMRNHRELERGRRRYYDLCELSLYLWYVYACSPRGRRPTYSPPPPPPWLRCLSRTSQRFTSQTSIKPSPITMAPRSSTPHTSQSVHPIFSTTSAGWVNLALVSQPGHQSLMRTFGNITTAIGAFLYEGYPDTIQSTQTSTDPRILCGGCRKTSPSLDSRSVACFLTPLSFLFFVDLFSFSIIRFSR
jgi:hypothetical protein